MARPPIQRIQTPAQLFPVVLGIAKAVEQGVLVHVPSPTQVVRLEDIVEGQPWPADHIELDFEEPATGKRFRLSVETYHGLGGTWQEV
ncbi:hypothetical protein AY599_19960 [Leptolyngbya valderiana BDU 20041]|nr:hypothetical protein AY599_19960 [Leptolyngbya valderiana BDU 20041]